MIQILTIRIVIDFNFQFNFKVTIFQAWDRRPK